MIFVNIMQHGHCFVCGKQPRPSILFPRETGGYYARPAWQAKKVEKIKQQGEWYTLSSTGKSEKILLFEQQKTHAHIAFACMIHFHISASLFPVHRYGIENNDESIVRRKDQNVKPNSNHHQP